MASLDKFRAVDIRLDKANEYYIETQFAKEGDYNGRDLVVQITNAGEVTSQTGVTLNLGWKHEAVGNKGLDPFEVVDASQGIFKISYPTEMLNAGTVVAVIQVVENTKITLTRNFKITVEKSPVDESAVVSENSFTVLQDALLTVNQYDNRIANVENTKVDKSTFEQNKNEVTAQLQQTEQGLSSQLAEAATKDELSQVASPLVASLVAQMTDTTRVYVYTGVEGGYVAGNWYYHNGTAWVSGGVYQSSGIGDGAVTTLKIADDAVTPAKINALVDSVNLFDLTAVTIGQRLTGTVGTTTTANGTMAWGASHATTGLTTLDSPLVPIYLLVNKNLVAFHFYDANGVLRGTGTGTLQGDGSYKYQFTVVAYPIKYFRAEYLTATVTDTSDMMICLDALPASYQPFGEFLTLNNMRVATMDDLPEPLIGYADGTNTVLGVGSGNVVLGTNNVAIGVSALALSDGTQDATAIGYQALQNNKPDGTTDAARYNVAVGYKAMQANTIGHHNTAVGWSALMKNTSGRNNSAFGEDALFNCTTGYQNSAFGNRAMQNLTSGDSNVAIGTSAAYSLTIGQYNTVIGSGAGASITDDTHCTIIGRSADIDKTDGIKKVNANAIGVNAKANKSNSMKLGNALDVVETDGDYEVLTIGNGVVLKSPDGTRYRITVANGGTLAVVAA